MEEQLERKKKALRLPGWARTLITVVLTLAVSLGGLCLALGRDGLALVEGWLLAKYAFVDTSADLSEAADRALEGLVAGLGDRWSYYLDAEYYESVLYNRANVYVGIGVTVSTEREEGLLVMSVAEGGPAELAGILAGEILVEVDGVSLAGEARHDGSDLIRGEEGTQVELAVLGTDGSRRTVTCVRAVLQNSSASGKMLEDHVGYVYLSNFYSGSAESFRREVDSLLEQGATGLVIDLRNNPGGYIAQLKEILDYLLPEGPVFSEKPRLWFGNVYQSDAACVEVPMVVLVNRDSYSAAELLAAQLRESIGAPIVGEVTSGKGYSQITFAMPNGGGLGLSVATYCTGQGVSLIGTGILPDVELELDQSQEEDNQLTAALELLKQR